MLNHVFLCGRPMSYYLLRWPSVFELCTVFDGIYTSTKYAVFLLPFLFLPSSQLLPPFLLLLPLTSLPFPLPQELYWAGWSSGTSSVLCCMESHSEPSPAWWCTSLSRNSYPQLSDLTRSPDWLYPYSSAWGWSSWQLVCHSCCIDAPVISSSSSSLLSLSLF